MSRNVFPFSLILLLFLSLGACSSEPAANTAKKADHEHHKIKGKAQVLPVANAADAALNAGGQNLFLWDGVKRYRLFVKTATELVPGKEYEAEGIYAQKTIDEIGDPDQGKKGYPLESSCQRAVRMAWSGLSFDAVDSYTAALRTMVKRYPARAVFLVIKVTPAPETAAQKEAADEDLPVVTVPAEKQVALLTAGPTTQPAPLWEPNGGPARCKVLIGKDGKIEELEGGGQLCEAVPWSEFQYKPTDQKGKPVKVKTEVEVVFKPRA